MFAGQQLTTGRSHKGADPADGDHCNINKHLKLNSCCLQGVELAGNLTLGFIIKIP